MSTPELILRLVTMTFGVGLTTIGLVLGYRDREQGCLPFAIAILGFLMIGTAFPSQEIFG